MQILTKNTGIKVLSLFIYLIPLALLTGPFLPDLFLSLSAIIFLIIVLADRNYKYFKNIFSYLFLSFCFIIIFSSILSEFKYFSLESSLVYVRFGLFALAVWFVIDNNRFFLKNFTIIFSIIMIFCVVDGYYQYLSGVSIFGYNTYDGFRLTLPFDNKLFLGGYLSRLFPLMLGLIILNSKSKYSYIFLCLMIILVDILVYVTGERTALVLMLISTIFIIMFLSKFRLLRIATLLISLISITIISVSDPSTKNRNINQTLDQLGVSSETGDINYLSPLHEGLILTGINMFKNNIFLGVGANNFRNQCDKLENKVNEYSCSSHPHSIPMQLMAETGILGFLYYVALLFFIFFILTRQLYGQLFDIKILVYNDYQICLICCLLLSIFPFLPSNNFFNNWINIIFYLPVGFFLHSIYSNTS